MPKTTSRRSIASKKIPCNLCKKEIKEDCDDYIQCDICKKDYHFVCSDLNRREFDRLLKNESELYSCEECKEGGGEIRKELNTIKSELKKLQKLDKLDQLTESINFMSAKFDEVFKDVAENKKKISAIEKENKKLKNELQDMKTTVKILNDDRVKNDCIINGLKVEGDIKAVDAVVNLSKSVGVDLESSAFDNAYFLPNKNKTNDNKTVVVKFSSKANKNKLMAAKSKLKENESTKKVFVNDYLSKETLSLLNCAKSLKSIGYQYIYARDGKVFCKKSEISKQQIVRCEEDVEQMLLDATTNKHWSRRSMVRNRDGAVSSDDGDEDEDATYASPS